MSGIRPISQIEPIKCFGCSGSNLGGDAKPEVTVDGGGL